MIEFLKDLFFFCLWVVVAIVAFNLGGCVFTRDTALDEGLLRVDADCSKQRIKVELDLDRTVDQKKARPR